MGGLAATARVRQFADGRAAPSRPRPPIGRGGSAQWTEAEPPLARGGPDLTSLS